MALQLKPLADRVVVRPAAAEEKTASGIIIPDNAKEKPLKGEILAIGGGRFTEDGKLVPMTLKVGDQVLYGRYSGTEVTVEGNDLLIMRESDILATI